MLSDSLRNCDFIIVKGYNADFRFMMKLKRASRAKIINHWVGSDVNKTVGNFRRWMKVRLAQFFIHQNWVVGRRLVEPLRKLGISSKVVPHFIFYNKEHKSKTYSKGILVYNPDSTPMPVEVGMLYGIDKAADLSSRLPNYIFHLVGGGKNPSGFLSYICYGYLHGLDKIWGQVDYYLRITLSDGMPRMILEAAENGILSISNYLYFDGIILYTNPDEVANQINSMTDKEYKERLDLLTNDIKKTYSPDAVINAYRTNLESRS